MGLKLTLHNHSFQWSAYSRGLCKCNLFVALVDKPDGKFLCPSPERIFLLAGKCYIIEMRM